MTDGCKQRDLYTKSEVSSPDLSLEGFLATLIIEALSERHVAIADVLGAFLKVDMNDFGILKLEGPAMYELLNVNNKKYIKYITESK